MPNNFSTTSDENTMDTGARREADNSVGRLRHRYFNINFERCIAEICSYLKINGNTNDFFDRYRVAERALYPATGAVGQNRDGNLEMTLYYWMAANDGDTNIISSCQDRRACFVRALYECQRGNNSSSRWGLWPSNSARINVVDNLSYRDENICTVGVLNKFAEVFVHMHPDVSLSVDINLQILELLRGFIAKHCYENGITYQNLISDELDLNISVPANTREIIKNLIVEVLGDASQLVNGLMMDGEFVYLNGCLNENLEYLSFISVRNTTMSSREVDECIASADYRLRDARAIRVERTVRELEYNSDNRSPVFNYDAISRIIKREFSLSAPVNSVSGPRFGFGGLGYMSALLLNNAPSQNIAIRNNPFIATRITLIASESQRTLRVRRRDI